MPNYITLNEAAKRLGWSYHRTRNNLMRNKNGVKDDNLFIHAKGSFLIDERAVERLKNG